MRSPPKETGGSGHEEFQNGKHAPLPFHGVRETGVYVFYPTMDEFRDFAKFMVAIEEYGMETGIVKVVPPREWVERLPRLDDDVKTIKIKNPIVQNIAGTGGLYRLQNIEKQKTYNLPEWRALCDEPEHQPPARRGEVRKGASKRGTASTAKGDEAFAGFDYRFDAAEFTPERCEELERTYWRSLTYSSPMYGADMPGSLFHDDTAEWNVAHLDNILNKLRVQIPGVNTAYLYCGMWKATFAWHLEDMDLFSINYIHFGAPKQWYSISQEDHIKFYNVMKEMWPQEHQHCKEFLRHKTFHASPSLLEQKGIKVNRIVHNQNEFMITFPYGYHSGFNYGYNVAESVNFATESWIPYGRLSSKCRCISDSVGIDVDQLVRHMHGLPSPEPSPEPESDLESVDAGAHTMLTPPYTGTPGPEAPQIRRKRVQGTGQSNRKRSAHQRKHAARDVVKSDPDRPASPKRHRVVRLEFGECALCPDMYNSDFLTNRAGLVKVHRVCAQRVPETRIVRDTKTGREIVDGLEDIPSQRRALRCLECGIRHGACIQCSHSSCVRPYHATCAASAGVLFIGDSQYCRFHRPKRPPVDKLEHDKFTKDWAFSLLPGDVAQCQMGNGDMFAGIVEQNNLSEETVLLRALPAAKDLIEVEWKWIRNPSQLPPPPSPAYLGAPQNENNTAMHVPQAHYSSPGMMQNSKMPANLRAPIVAGQRITFPNKKQPCVATSVVSVEADPTVKAFVTESLTQLDSVAGQVPGAGSCWLTYRPDVSSSMTDVYDQPFGYHPRGIPPSNIRTPF